MPSIHAINVKVSDPCAVRSLVEADDCFEVAIHTCVMQANDGTRAREFGIRVRQRVWGYRGEEASQSSHGTLFIEFAGKCATSDQGPVQRTAYYSRCSPSQPATSGEAKLMACGFRSRHRHRLCSMEQISVPRMSSRSSGLSNGNRILFAGPSGSCPPNTQLPGSLALLADGGYPAGIH